MATQNHIFSTGVLRVGAPGVTPLLTDGTATVGVVQDIGLDITYTRKELMEAAQVSVFAVDNADHEGKAVLKIGSADFNRLLLPYVAGMTKTTASNVDTFTLGKTSKPAPCRVELDAVDTSGKNVKLIAQNCKFKGFGAAAKIADFETISLECDIYPDASNNVLTLAMDQ